MFYCKFQYLFTELTQEIPLALHQMFGMFHKWYSSQKSNYIIKVSNIFISSKYLNLQGTASEHSNVIIIQFCDPLLYSIPYVLTPTSLNYKAIIMQFSDPFLIIISTTTGSKYVKFVRYHLKVSSHNHIYNS